MEKGNNADEAGVEIESDGIAEEIDQENIPPGLRETAPRGVNTGVEGSIRDLGHAQSQDQGQETENESIERGEEIEVDHLTSDMKDDQNEEDDMTSYD